MGSANVWVNRRGKQKAEASKRVEIEPDLVVADLAALADLLA
jgi:hypothetical protein